MNTETCSLHLAVSYTTRKLWTDPNPETVAFLIEVLGADSLKFNDAGLTPLESLTAAAQGMNLNFFYARSYSSRDYDNWLERVNKTKAILQLAIDREARGLAVCMSGQKRLGAGSLLRLIQKKEILQKIGLESLRLCP